MLSSKNGAIVFFANRDLLNATEGSVETLWKLPPAAKMLKRQQEDGSWKYPGGNLSIRSRANYNQLETYRILGELVEKYGFNNNHPAVRKAAEFFSDFKRMKETSGESMETSTLQTTLPESWNF